ncbi:unnamed protein product [Prunus armeniaca]
MGRWMRRSWSDNCILSTGTYKHRKVTGNGETSQPPVQSNRVGGWGNHGWTPVLSSGTCKHLKRTGEWENWLTI